MVVSKIIKFQLPEKFLLNVCIDVTHVMGQEMCIYSLKLAENLPPNVYCPDRKYCSGKHLLAISKWALSTIK